MLEDVALLLRMLIFFLLRRKNFAFTMCIYFLQVASVLYKLHRSVKSAPDNLARKFEARGEWDVSEWVRDYGIIEPWRQYKSGRRQRK